MAKKRFIAGAICPKCHVLDRVVVEQSNGITRRRCVSCGFSDEQPATTKVTLPTRFVARGLANVQARPVRLLDD